jgi:hypothetical protein
VKLKRKKKLIKVPDKHNKKNEDQNWNKKYRQIFFIEGWNWKEKLI